MFRRDPESSASRTTSAPQPTQTLALSGTCVWQCGHTKVFTLVNNNIDRSRANFSATRTRRRCRSVAFALPAVITAPVLLLYHDCVWETLVPTDCELLQTWQQFFLWVTSKADLMSENIAFNADRSVASAYVPSLMKRDSYSVYRITVSMHASSEHFYF